MNRLERRGARYLDNPPKPRDVKRPIEAFVHYISQGGDRVAFRITGAVDAIRKLGNAAAFKGRPDVVEHVVSLKLASGYRLIKLPSQCE